MRYGAATAWVVLLLLCGPAVSASPCPPDTDRPGAGLVCPVAGGGTVRQPDACAREGGTVRANRGAGKHHNGLDINATEGTPVVAAEAGRVALASRNWGPLGNTVILDHGDGDYTVYGHLRRIAVGRNVCVAAGQVIGAVGYTGNAKCLRDNGLSAHLHFAFIRASRPGLADAGGPLAAAIKVNDHWASVGRRYFAGAGLGIQDPEPALGGAPGCLR